MQPLKLFFIAAFYIYSLVNINIHAQHTVKAPCATDEQMEIELQRSPAMSRLRAAYERAYRRMAADDSARERAKKGTVYTIPVVVHIIHDGAELGTSQNPSDDQIAALIDEASQRFRHSLASNNSYSNPFYGVDTEIDLCLATTDPSGNYSTGVTRHFDPSNSVVTSDGLPSPLSMYSWDTNNYCNLFLVSSITNAAGFYSFSLDGTVYSSESFWSGLIAHELGHYFTLWHTFQNENFSTCPANSDCFSSGDFVCDTPPIPVPSDFNTSCVNPPNSCTSDEADTSLNNPYRSVALGGMGDQPDMPENYMDYSASCFDAFTQGQKTRMQFNITTNRTALIASASTACATQATPANNAGLVSIIPNNNACSPDFDPDVIIKNYGSSTLTSCEISLYINNSLVLTQNWTGSLAPGATISTTLATVTLPGSGNFLIKAETAQPNGATDANIYDDEAYASVVFGQSASAPYDQDFAGCAAPTGFAYNGWEFLGYSTACQECIAYLVKFSSTPTEYELTLPLLDFTGINNPQISFTLGHIPRYDFLPNDELRIEVSAGCNTPAIVYQKSGLDKATNSPPAYTNGVYTIPLCTEFRIETINLSSFGNMQDVQINFIADGQWYSPIIIDDIVVEDVPDPCGTPPPISGIIPSGVYSSQDIISGGTIDAPSTVDFRASSSIVLTSDFEVSPAASFHGYLTNCGTVQDDEAVSSNKVNGNDNDKGIMSKFYQQQLIKDFIE